MNKGLILKIKKDYAILLSDNNQYIRIKLKDGMAIGQKIWFLDEDIVLQEIKSNKASTKILAIVAIAALFAVMFVTPIVHETPFYALVSVDINPSLDIKVDIDQNVLEIISLNEDAELIVSQEMIGMDIMIVMDQIIHNAELHNFLTTENNNILISSATFGENHDDLGVLIETYLEDNLDLTTNIRVIYIESDLETAEKSLDKGVSLGRLELAKLNNKEASNEQTISDIVSDESIQNELEEKIVFDDNKNERDLDELLAFIRKLGDVETDDIEITTFLFGIQARINDENANLKSLKEEAKHHWNRVKNLNKFSQENDGNIDNDLEASEELESLLEWIEKLSLVPDEETAIVEFLANIDARMNQENADLKALKNEAKEHWNRVKHLYDATIDSNEDLANESADLLKSLNTYVELLIASNTSDDEILDFLSTYEQRLTSDVTNIASIRNEAKAHWNRIKKDSENKGKSNESNGKSDQSNGKNDIVELVKLLNLLEPHREENARIDSFIILVYELIKEDNVDLEELKQMAEDFIESLGLDDDKSNGKSKRDSKTHDDDSDDNDDSIDTDDSDDNDDSDDSDDESDKKDKEKKNNNQKDKSNGSKGGN